MYESFGEETIHKSCKSVSNVEVDERSKMSKDNPIPEFKSYQEMAEFWDTHSLADYWDQTEPAEFEVSTQLRRRYLVAIARDILGQVQ